jgi:2-polyprenyl-6-methoxyphenol hydroxylase-like FAD-dependent oxidoreductase
LLDAPVVWSKAAVVHARTMELFDGMGLAQAVLERATPVHGVNIYAAGRRVAHVTFQGMESPYPAAYGISQHDTEALLAEELARLGGRVERGVRLEGFTQDVGGVKATLVHGGERVETVETPWIVGCDGAHSTVRKTMEVAFGGMSYDERLIQSDLRVETAKALVEDEIHTFLGEGGPVALFPLFRDGRFRLIVVLPPGAPDVEPTLEVFQRFVDERVPNTFKLSDPAWMIGFRIHCRRANQYRVGRAFLAGDAAHIHSPIGGQGMNTGIQDAKNLGWKLALACKGPVAPAVLDSYEAERLPVAKGLLAATNLATRGMESTIALRHPVALGLRNQLISFVTSLDFVGQRVSRSLSMLEVNYRGSPLVGQERAAPWQGSFVPDASHEAPGLLDWSAFGDGPAPGDRAVDVPVDGTQAAGVTATRLFDLLRDTRHTLLAFDGAAATEAGYRNLEAIGREVERRYGDRVAVHVLVPRPARPDALRWSGSVILDASAAIHRRYGARAECLYLVRPDGYVAYRTQPASLEKILAYLKSIFTV